VVICRRENDNWEHDRFFPAPVSRLIRALDTRKTRARLDRLVRDGKI